MTFHPRLSIIVFSLPAGSALQSRPVRYPGEIKLAFSFVHLHEAKLKQNIYLQFLFPTSRVRTHETQLKTVETTLKILINVYDYGLFQAHWHNIRIVFHTAVALLK